MTVSNGPARRFVIFALAAAAGLVAATGAGAETLWALERGGPHLRIIDRATGADITTISSSVNGRWRGVALHPTDGVLYATETEYLYAVAKTTGATTQIGLFGSVLVRDLTFDDLGQLYGVTGNNGSDTNSLHLIDTANGSATLLFALSGVGGHGIAHDPDQPGTLYHLAVETLRGGPEAFLFERVDLANGALTPVGSSGDSITGRPLGLEYDAVDGVFRFFDEAGRYYAVDRDGTVTAAGTQNPTLYAGLGFDQESFEILVFRDGFESGDTSAWSGMTP